MASFNTKPSLHNPRLTSVSLASKGVETKSSLSSPLISTSSIQLSSKLGAPTATGSSLLTGPSLTSKSRPSLLSSSLSKGSSLSSSFHTKSHLSTTSVVSVSSAYKPSSLSTFSTLSSEKKQENIFPQKIIDEDEGVIPFLGCSTEDLPFYTLVKEPIEQVTALGFPDPCIDLTLSLGGFVQKASNDVTNAKRQLLHGMAAALIGGPNYKDPQNHGRLVLMHIASRVAFYDPEFLLKSVLYARQELNLRTPSNFMLAFASLLHSCRPYLKRYYRACIRLPSDWIEVSELYQTLCDSDIKFKSLPVALRKAMVSKFPDFDHYQLAKYNKDKAKNKKKREKKKGKAAPAAQAQKAPEPTPAQKAPEPTPAQKAPEPTPAQKAPSKSTTYGFGRLFDDSDSLASYQSSTDSETATDSESDDGWNSEDEWSKIQLDDNYSVSVEEMQQLSFTLKQLIRKLHISAPVEPVMALLGKRYPEDPEAFRRVGLPGMWDEEKAGKRMRLPVPETWETQISTKGNKPKVWEDLIDHQKLPFMAMLRNIRNLLLAGVQPKYTSWVMKKLNDEYAVTNSRQFPFRFFSAYQALEEVEKKKAELEAQQGSDKEVRARGYLASSGRGGRGGRGGGGGRGGRGRGRGRGRGIQRGPTPKQLDKADENFWKDLEKYQKVDNDVLKRMRDALDNAVKIATKFNIQPIPGVTVVLCCVSNALDVPCTAFKGMGKPRTVKEVGLLLGLMCKYSCEECKLVGFTHDFQEFELGEGTILHNLSALIQLIDNSGLKSDTSGLPVAYLKDFLKDRIPIDNLIVLSNTIDYDSEENSGRKFKSFLRKYREFVNPNLLFVSVDLSSPRATVDESLTPEHENDIFLSGYSDQILSFITQRGDGGQLTHVENIDLKYNLKEKEEKKKPVFRVEESSSKHKLRKSVPLPGPSTSSWRSCRVFISSTFLDMHGERDLLTRYVFPELRARAEHLKVRVYEVDLRWGVTKQQSQNKESLGLCLAEANRCDLFVGLLGERYGWVPGADNLKNLPDGMEWVQDEKHLEDASITELESTVFALDDFSNCGETAFFYFRDNSALARDVLPEYISHFYHEDKEREQVERLGQLKERVRRSGLEVFDNYPANWGGIVGGVPVAGGLTEFGNRVLNNLWNAIQKAYPEEEEADKTRKVDISREHTEFIDNLSEGFIGRKTALKDLLNRVTMEGQQGGVLSVSGKPGSGKSALMCQLSQQLISWMGIRHVISHICGAAPGSTDIVNILMRLYAEIARRFPSIECGIPQEYQELVTGLPELLRQVSKRLTTGVPLVVIFDGMDQLEETFMSQSLNWLADPVPENILFIMSVVEGSQIELSLGKRTNKPAVFKLKGLDVFDKQELVQTLLARHHKKLEEGAFSGEMRVLLSKKEADNPLFLTLACEELRVFGIFEKIGERVKKLSQTLPLLLQEILTRLEEDHGRETARQALSLIVCSRNGLDEEELGQLILPKLAPANLQRLIRAVSDFIKSTENENSLTRNLDALCLSQGEARKAVKLRYMKGAEGEKEWNSVLSNFFLERIDPDGDMSWKGRFPRAYRDVSYHLNKAFSFKKNASLLTDITFLEVKCHSGHCLSLLEDYTPPSNLPSAQTREYTKYMCTPLVKCFHDFISSNLHILSRTPSLILQQSLNSSIPAVVQAGKQIAANKGRPDSIGQLALWDNKPSREVLEQMTIGQQGHVAKCIAVSQDGRFLACGTSDCLIKMYLISTGQEAKTFVGHSGPVISICFSGETRLCSASEDNSLCLWDIIDGYRIAVMKKHSKKVTQCVAGSDGRQIISASWDCTGCVWNAKTGAFVSQLKVAVRPLNCVALHPENQLAVFGGWDCNVRMWDTFNQKKLKIMKGHATAVRALAYAPSARHVVSAALNGEVKIWSTKAGTQVGSITGHNLPLTSLSYTPNGQFLVTGSEDCKAKVWSGLIGKPLMTIASPGASYAMKVKFSPCGQFILAGYYNGLVCKFAVGSGCLEREIDSRQFAARCLEWSPRSGDACIVGYDDGVVLAYDTEDGRNTKSLQHHDRGVHCLAWHPHHIATGGADYTVCLWSSDVRGKKLKADVAIPDAVLTGHIATVTGLSFSPDGMKLVSVGQDCKLIIWDTLNHKMMQCIEAGHKDWINTCAYSDSGDFVITGSQDFTLKMWNVKEAKDAKEKGSFEGHMSSVNDVVYTKGVVGSACLDGTVKIWTHRGVEITTLHCHKQRINGCDLHLSSSSETLTRQTKVKQEADSLRYNWADEDDEENDPTAAKKNFKLEDIQVATASDDGTIKLWQPFIANEICSITGHGDRIVSLATTPNNHFVTSSLDTYVKLWQPELDQEKPYQSFYCHNAPISSFSISPSADRLVMTSRETSVSLWNVTWRDDASIVAGNNLRLTKIYSLTGHSRAPTTSCYATDTNFCTGGEDSRVICWSYSPSQGFPKKLASVQELTYGSVTSLSYLSRRKHLLVGFWNGKVVVYAMTAISTGNLTQLIILDVGFQDWVMSMSVHKDELFLISMDKKLAVVTLSDASPKHSKSIDIEKYYKEPEPEKKTRSAKYPKRVFPTQIAFYKQFTMLGDSSGVAVTFIDGSPDFKKFKLHDKMVTALLQFKGHLISCGMDSKVKLWSLSVENTDLSLEQIGEYSCKSPVTHAKLYPTPHPDRVYVLAGDQFGNVDIINWH